MKKCFTINPNRSVSEIESYAELLANNTYQGVEIFYPYNRQEDERRAFTDALLKYQAYNIEFICHLPYGKDNNVASYHNLENVMARLFKAIDWAHQFGVKKCTFHPGMVDELSRIDAIILAAKNIKILCNYAKQYDMTIMLENLIGEQELMRVPAEYFEIKKMVNEPNLKFIFDVAHFHASVFDDGDVQNIIDFVDEIKDDLCHLHLCDNMGKRDTHSRLGTGNIDFRTYFHHLKEVGYVSTVSSEVLFNTKEDLYQTAQDIDFFAK